MRSIFLIGLVALLMVSCEKDSDSIKPVVAVDPYIEENYLHDARQLYYHEVYNDSTHVNRNNPEIDEGEVNEILKIIQAVYNSDSPQRDIVFETYQIHNRYGFDFNTISLKVDTSSPYIRKLVNNRFVTGNALLDKALLTYDFDSVKPYYGYPRFPWLTIHTDKNFNMIPVVKEFKNLSFIKNASFDKFLIGDGNNITLDRSGESAVITFSIGSGDCPAGCIYHKYWEFRVIDGVARFIRTYETGD